MDAKCHNAHRMNQHSMRVWHAPGILWGNFTPQNCATTNREAWFFRGLVGVGQNQDFQDELVGSGQVLSLSCLNRGFSRRTRIVLFVEGRCLNQDFQD